MAPENRQPTISNRQSALSPFPVRLLVWLLLVALALGAIWLIDRRALLTMQRMQEQPRPGMQQDPSTPGLSESASEGTVPTRFPLPSLTLTSDL